MKTNKRRFVWIALAFVVLAAVTPVVLLAMLNSEWLKTELSEKVATALDAEFSVDEIEFSPFSGEADLTNVDLVRTREKSTLDVSISQVHVELDVWALMRRKVILDDVTLVSPRIDASRVRAKRELASSTLEKLENFLNKRTVDRTPRKPQRLIKATDVLINRLSVKNASLKYSSTCEGEIPFEVASSNIDYLGTEISGLSLYRLVYGSTLKCDLEMGERAVLVKDGHASPPTFDLTDVSLVEFDRLFDQTDALELTGGKMEVSYSFPNDDSVDVSVVLTNVMAGVNEDAANQQFMFAPADKIAAYINEHGEKIELTFSMSPDHLRFSEDIEFLAVEVWKGIWLAIAERMIDSAKESAKEAGKEKAVGFWNNIQKKMRGDESEEEPATGADDGGG